MCRQIITVIVLIFASISCISADGKCQLLQERGDDGRSIAYLCVEVTFDYVKDISEQADWIEFSVSKLHIPEKAFARFSLRTLSFYKCDMRYIDPKAFEGLVNLQRLTFWESNIHVLPASWFKGMHSLTHLSLEKSDLVYIEPKTFLEIPNLQHLDIADNNLNCLPEQALAPLRRLKHVRIGKNPWLCNCHAELIRWMLNRRIDFGAKNMSVVEFECMSELHTTKRTEVFGNSSMAEVASLTVQPGGTCRSKTLPILSMSLDNSEVINLADVEIRTIPEFAFFRFGNSLRKLSLSNCSIGEIHPEAFAGLPKLEELILFNNSISTVNAEWFRDFRNLKHLSLNRNKIKQIQSNVFPLLDKLEILNLEHNWIECLPTDTFGLMKNLKNVNIARNPWKCSCLNDLMAWLDKRQISYHASLGQCTNGMSQMTNGQYGSGYWNNSYSFSNMTKNFTEKNGTFTEFHSSFTTGSEDHHLDMQRNRRSAIDVEYVPAANDELRKRQRREPQRNIGQGCHAGYSQRQPSNYICPPTCKRVSTRFFYECFGGTLAGLSTVPGAAESIKFENSVIPILYDNAFGQFGGFLRSLQFWSCGIETIEPYAFAGLFNLQELILDGNNIHEVQATWFDSTRNLERLILTRNSITRIENRVYHLLPNLREFVISDNQLNCIGIDSLYYMSRLAVMDINKNPWLCLCRKKLIEWMDEHRVEYNKDISRAYLDWNCVDLSQPPVTTLPTFRPRPPPPPPPLLPRPRPTTVSPLPRPPPPPSTTPSLPPYTAPPSPHPSPTPIIIVGGGHCQMIPEGSSRCRCIGGDMSILQEIPNFAERIEIINSTLLHITADSFVRFSELKELIFINCSIGDISPLAFRGLNKLKYLQFESNSIPTIRSAWFYDLEALTELNLAGNHITEIEGDVFEYLPNLEVLSLDDNNIGCIYTKSLNATKSLQRVTMHNNPWKWRCMEELTQYFDTRNITYNDFRNYMGKPIACELKGDVSPDKPSGSTNTSISTVNVLCVSIAMIIFTKF